MEGFLLDLEGEERMNGGKIVRKDEKIRRHHVETVEESTGCIRLLKKYFFFPRPLAFVFTVDLISKIGSHYF